MVVPEVEAVEDRVVVVGENRRQRSRQSQAAFRRRKSGQPHEGRLARLQSNGKFRAARQSQKARRLQGESLAVVQVLLGGVVAGVAVPEGVGGVVVQRLVVGVEAVEWQSADVQNDLFWCVTKNTAVYKYKYKTSQPKPSSRNKILFPLLLPFLKNWINIFHLS